MISTSHQFIFIHLPKTGGNSVQDALRDFADDEVVAPHAHQDGVERFELRNPKHKKLVKHSTLKDYVEALGPAFDDFKVYTTIRNPYDRIVSYYFSPHRGKVEWRFSKFKAFAKTVATLDEFITLAPDRTPDLGRITAFLRFERLEQDFAAMCADLGLGDVRLPHRNKSLNRRDYRDCYDDELIAWVRDRHKLELDLGNYSF